MHSLSAALWAEWMKTRRSRVVWLAFAAFSLLPFIGGFFMVLLGNPEAAANAGLMAQKAKLLSGQADWPSFLSIICQGIAVGGMIVFGFIASWLFGREHADRTLKDILALPTPRWAIVAAKYLLFLLVGLALSAGIFGEALLVGYALNLPGGARSILISGAQTYFIAAALTIIICFPVAFFAHLGKGYLSALGFVLLSLMLAQVVAVAGAGPWFPWSVPALYAGTAGTTNQPVTAWSYVIVIATSLAGAAATFWIWQKD